MRSRCPPINSGLYAAPAERRCRRLGADQPHDPGRIYLNFGDDWRSDFTISIDRKEIPAFAAAGIDLKVLAGKKVRVRGWIEWRNGAMIAATHPEQLELLPDAPASGDAMPTSPSPTTPALN
jgi:hypothetical protein